MKLFIGTGFLLLSIALNLPVLADDSITIAPKFTPGNSHYLEITQELTNKSTGGRFGPEGRTVQGTGTRTVKWSVDSVSPDGLAKLRLTFDRLQRAMKNPRQPLAFDSDEGKPADASNPFSSMFNPMIGMPLTLEIEKSGAIKSCKGMNDVLDKIEDTVAGNQAFEQLRDEFGDDAARVLWGDARLALYSFKPVKVGDTWNRSFSFRSYTAGELLHDYECKLERLGERNGKKVAELSFKATIKRKPGSPPPPTVMGTVMEYERGDITGTAVYDIERGLVISEAEESTTIVNGTGGLGSSQANSTMRIERTMKQSARVMTEDDRAKQRAEIMANAATSAAIPPVGESPK